MTQNPYQTPTIPATPFGQVPGGPRLREIASAQRQVNLAVLLYLCLIPVNVALTVLAERAAWASYALGFLGFCVFIFGAVSVYKLAALFRGKVVAIIYVLGFLVPCLGLILLLIISQSATKILQEHGIKVGLLGADPKSIS